MIRETRWERDLHQRASAASFLVAADRVVVHERRTRLVCLHREDGSVLWDVPVGTWPRDLVIAHGRCLVLPQRPDRLICLDLCTGAVVWQVGLAPHSGHVVTSGEAVVVGGWRGYTPLTAFSLLDGRLLWRSSSTVRTALPVRWAGGVLMGHGREAWLTDPRDGSETARWQLPEPLTDGELSPVFTALGPDHCLARLGARSSLRLQPSGTADQLTDHGVDLAAEGARCAGGAVWWRQSRGGYLVTDPGTGAALWRVDAGQPLAGGVVRVTDGFVVAGQGALFRVRSGGGIVERAPHPQRLGALRDLGGGDVLATTRGTLQALALALEVGGGAGGR